MKARLIAEYLCNLQPFSVRIRLVRDETFKARFDLTMRTVVTLGGAMRVDQHELVDAARRALVDQQPQSLTDVDGHEMLVKVEQGLIFLESPTKRTKRRLESLMILSPNKDDRTRALSAVLEHLGPTAPDFSALLNEAKERELTDAEVDTLLAENAMGVTALQARATAALNRNQATLENLVPDSLAYFERFCGPDPKGVEPEEYLRTVLPAYRKGLIRRDLVRGLDICLQGALRDDLMPGAWIEDLHDDQIWNALETCHPWRDPFALLGAFDIALSRQHDERYRTFADRAIAKLAGEEFLRHDGIDTYELLPLVAKVVINRINMLEGGALRPPFWKRMCAWMQAGFLLRLTHRFALDLEGLREWGWRNQSAAGMYAEMLDLRLEPMYRASDMSRAAFREEIVGRLTNVRKRHEDAGRTIPGSKKIDEAVSQLADQGSPLGWALPGPLEGHRLPAEIGVHKLPEEVVKKAEEELVNDSALPLLSNLAYLSQLCDLGSVVLARMREAIGRIALDSEAAGLDERFGRLSDASVVACVQRDTDLAHVIASKVLATAHQASSNRDVVRILQALLIAGAAFREEDEWAHWLEKQLAEAAARLGTGEPSKTFLENIRELKKVLKLTLGIHGRAEALASAAN